VRYLFENNLNVFWDFFCGINVGAPSPPRLFLNLIPVFDLNVIFYFLFFIFGVGSFGVDLSSVFHILKPNNFSFVTFF
jgi:hypothetical protein